MRETANKMQFSLWSVSSFFKGASKKFLNTQCVISTIVDKRHSTTLKLLIADLENIIVQVVSIMIE